MPKRPYGTAMGWLVFSNLYVACCGAALTAASYALLGSSPRIDRVVLLVFFGTLVIYNLDRLVEPAPGDSAHERWVAEHRRPLWGLTLLAALGACACLPGLTAAAIASLLIPAALSIGYCVPVYRSGGRWRRLKTVPGGKLLLIAGVWTYATLALPQINSVARIGTATLALLLLSRVLFLLAVAMPFDLPDAARDRAAGIRTLPQRLGVDGTRRLAVILAVVSGGLAVGCPWPYAAGLLVSCAITVAVVRGLHADRGVMYYEVLLDGMLLVQAGLIALLWAGGSGAV